MDKLKTVFEVDRNLATENDRLYKNVLQQSPGGSKMVENGFLYRQFNKLPGNLGNQPESKTQKIAKIDNHLPVVLQIDLNNPKFALVNCPRSEILQR